MRGMKDSGIDGVGKTPVHWETTRLCYDCYIRARLGWRGLKADEYVEEGYAFISAFNIQNGKLVWAPLNFITKVRFDESPEIKLHVGDVLLVKDGALGKCARVDELPMGETAPNSSLAVITPNEKYDYRYIYYYLQSSVFNDFVVLLHNGIGVPHLTQELMRKINILMPPVKEQTAISDFLDSKCAEIDALTADIQSQIDTLEQYKRSLITETVTKGLNPDVEMKDSGIEWIGEIPAHWCVHPIYFYFGERKNKNQFGIEDNLLSLSYGRVVRKDIKTSDGLLPESFNTYNIVEPMDIIIRPTDLQNDKHSLRTGLVKEHGIITSAYIALRPLKKIDSRYFHFLLYCFDVLKVFYNMGNGVRQGLNFSEFSRLIVFEPIYKEQVAISDYLESKICEIDSIVEQKKMQIENLGEYKKSLIFEYVTGKKEVPVA